MWLWSFITVMTTLTVRDHLWVKYGYDMDMENRGLLTSLGEMSP